VGGSSRQYPVAVDSIQFQNRKEWVYRFLSVVNDFDLTPSFNNVLAKKKYRLYSFQLNILTCVLGLSFLTTFPIIHVLKLPVFQFPEREKFGWILPNP
jgi:hypothetical protein